MGLKPLDRSEIRKLDTRLGSSAAKVRVKF